VGWILKKSRAGLTLRAVGESHTSAHALGVPVRRIRFLAVLFGGACSGLAGAYLSLAYTPFWAPGMTAGRGWIALALVVFASWRPFRAFAGAILFGGATVLQLHAQAASFGIPGQALTALPYLATIVALILLSLNKRRGAVAPAALGTSFIPER
jgi:simple sugar transport system permease protein